MVGDRDCSGSDSDGVLAVPVYVVQRREQG